MEKLNYLNLGCGNRYIDSWINIDFISNSDKVIAYDLTKKFPLEDASCAVVYHSHVLEHFSKEEAEIFLKECFRVMEPNGVIRVVVPDLEQLMVQYMAALKTVRAAPSALAEAEYEWAVIELMDQMVREISGGEMLKYWRKPVIVNEDHVTNRLGDEFLRFRKAYKPLPAIEKKKPSLYERARNSFFSSMRVNPKHLQTGRFRHGGEVHKWMYDSHSLSMLLGKTGFTGMTVQTATGSSIPNWERFVELDIKDGKIRKPDSLFVEARKP